MADHLHDTRYLVGGHKTPAFTLGDNLIRHLVLLGLEDRRLVETDGRGVHAHIGKDYVHVCHSSWESQMIGQGQRNV